VSPFVFPIQSFYDINGRPLIGGRLHSFETNSDTPQATYTNPEGTELNENPIILNERGECRIYLDDTKLYRFVLKDSHGNTIWAVDKISSASTGSGEVSPVSVDGTTDQIKVTESVIGGVKHFVVGLSSTVTAFFASVQYNISQLVSALANKKDKQNPLTFVGSTVQTVTRIAQDANGKLDVDFDEVSFPDWTSAINTAFLLCEQKDNKKTTVTGNEGSNTYYPTIKAIVDYLDSRLQNLGGKKITNNGVPFTTSSQLPTTTPFYGQNINSDDYAYVQDTGLASRYTAIVTGSSVVWSLDYEIALPVFTAEQQAAIDSGVTAEMLDTFLTKTGDGSNVTATFTVSGPRKNISTGEKLSVIFGKIAKWFGDLKTLAFRDTVGTAQIDDDSVTAAKVKDNETLSVHISGTAESSKRFNNEVGTSGADGRRAIFGGIDSGNNVKITMSERTGGVSKATEITPSGISTTGGMIIGGDIIIGGSNPATDVKNNSNLAVLIASKANKASSGNGNLAVIDANGNYASSGIGAYAQSQLNSAITNSVIPWLTDNSYIVTHSFWLQTNTSVVGRAVEFVNSYTGENLLRISVAYDYLNGSIYFILPWSNASWNGWIIENPDPQSTAEVGGAIITANGTKHASNSSSSTVTPFYTHTEETIHSNNVSQTTIGTFDVGKSTMYDTSSYYDFVITLFNGLSSKMVTLKISMTIYRYVSGSGITANIIGMATIDASGLNT
jgi:hypothetical protein